MPLVLDLKVWKQKTSPKENMINKKISVEAWKTLSLEYLYIKMEAFLVHSPDTSKIDSFNGTFFKRW